MKPISSSALSSHNYRPRYGVEAITEAFFIYVVGDSEYIGANSEFSL